MGAIAGVVRFDGSKPDESLIGHMLDQMAYRGNGGREVRSVGFACFGSLRSLEGPADAEDAQPLSHGSDLFAADCRVDAPGDPGAPGPSRLYDVVQDAVPQIQPALGEFGFAWWDGSRLWLGTDFLAQRPVYWHRDKHGVAFASTLWGLFPAVEGQLVPDRSWFADRRLMNPIQKRATAVHGVHRVEMGTVETHIPGSRVHRHRYWSPWQVKLQPRLTMEQAAEGIRERMLEAVEARVPSGWKLGVALSGGLDSGAVFSCAHRSGLNPTGVTMHFPDFPGSDEWEWLDAYRDWGEELRRINVQEYAADWNLEERIFTGAGYPMTLHSSFLLGMTHEVGDNFDVIMDGTDGDSVFGHGFLEVAGMLGRGRIPTAWRWARMKKNGRAAALKHLIRKAEQAWFPVRPMGRSIAATLIHGAPGSHRRLFGANVTHKRLSAGIRLVRQTYPRPAIFRPDEAHQRHQLASGIHGEMAAFLSDWGDRKGTRWLCPILDRRVVEWSLQVPSRLRTDGHLGRLFLRHGMRGIVPESILQRTGKTSFDDPLIKLAPKPLVEIARDAEQFGLNAVSNPPTVEPQG